MRYVDLNVVSMEDLQGDGTVRPVLDTDVGDPSVQRRGQAF